MRWATLAHVHCSEKMKVPILQGWKFSTLSLSLSSIVSVLSCVKHRSDFFGTENQWSGTKFNGEWSWYVSKMFLIFLNVFKGKPICGRRKRAYVLCAEQRAGEDEATTNRLLCLGRAKQNEQCSFSLLRDPHALVAIFVKQVINEMNFSWTIHLRQQCVCGRIPNDADSLCFVVLLLIPREREKPTRVPAGVSVIFTNSLSQLVFV